MRKTIKIIFVNCFAWIISLIVLIPVIIILINSLKTQAEAVSMTLIPPQKLQFNNYLQAIEQGKLVISFLNSAIYSITGSFIVVISCSMAAFVLSRNSTKINRFIYYFIILGIALPVNYVALMNIMKVTMLINTRIGISFLYAAVNIPLYLFITYAFINTIPKELDEAAVIDGCGPVSLFFYIIFPLLKPVLITVGVLCFMFCWNEFMLPLYYLNSSSKWPMSLAVYSFFGQFRQQWNLVCADIVLTSLPVVLIYIFGQKYIVSGMTAGAIKG